MRVRLISVNDPLVVCTVRGKGRVGIGVLRRGKSCVSGRSAWITRRWFVVKAFQVNS